MNNVFQTIQKNGRNKKPILEGRVNEFYNPGMLEGITLKVVLEKGIRHLMNYEHETYETCIHLTDLKSHLQPVYVCLGRSFEFIYLSLIFVYISGKEHS